MTIRTASVRELEIIPLPNDRGSVRGPCALRFQPRPRLVEYAGIEGYIRITERYRSFRCDDLHRHLVQQRLTSFGLYRSELRPTPFAPPVVAWSPDRATTG